MSKPKPPIPTYGFDLLEPNTPAASATPATDTPTEAHPANGKNDSDSVDAAGDISCETNTGSPAGGGSPGPDSSAIAQGFPPIPGVGGGVAQSVEPWVGGSTPPAAVDADLITETAP